MRRVTMFNQTHLIGGDEAPGFVDGHEIRKERLRL